MKNLGGCGALVGEALLIFAVLLYWTMLGPSLPPGVAETQARCLLLIVGGSFVACLVVVCQAPMGRGR